MTNAERILATIRAHPGLTDAEIRTRTNINPHQAVNQICRRLQAEGHIQRIDGPDGRIINVPSTANDAPSEPTSPPHAVTAPAATATAPAVVGRDATETLSADTLFVIPCSGSKATGGMPQAEGPSVVDLLDSCLATQLRDARQALSSSADLDESRLLPAWRRYTGRLYAAAGPALSDATARHTPLVILSGAYGLLLGDEPIGTYSQRFHLHDWPKGLLEKCLATVAERTQVSRVVAFCAASTDYAHLVRRVPWADLHIHATLAAPDMAGRGGGMVLVPRASGEGLRIALQTHQLASWTSSDGITTRFEELA